MGNGRSKINTPYVAIAFAMLVVAVVASLILYPEWRQSPTQLLMLMVLAAVGVVGFLSNAKSIFIRDKVDAPQAPLDYDSPQHRRNQENVCANVRTAWIDGVLRDSLPERVRLELALNSPPGMLQRRIVSIEGPEPRREPASAADIADIYRASGRALLILGAPGSGKTVTLLELCRPILEGAEADPRRPVPVVLNLSTWAQKQAPLAEWIADEMWRQYGLNRKVTPVWLAADHLILLLDGLDEVAADARDVCVRAINDFRETHGAGLAVCSRSADYAELRERLALSRAVEILPLTPAQVEGYLSDEQLALDGVREAIARDDALRELATTPLMLNVMAVAYGGRPLAELLPLLDSQNERRAHLYDAYLARMFRRKPLTDASYTAGQALRWLRFLAARLTEREETQYFIEDMQPDWLPMTKRLWTGAIISLVCMVLVNMLLLFFFSEGAPLMLSNSSILLMSLFFGAGLGIFSLFTDIKPVDELVLDISPYNVRRTIRENLVLIVIFGFLGGILTNIISGGFIASLSGIIIGMLFGFLGMFFGDGPTSLLKPLQSKNRIKVNQRINRSVINTFIVGIFLSTLFFILIAIMSRSIRIGIGLGLPFGMLTGLEYYGGVAVIRHYLLRLFLYINHVLPLRLVPFLDAMRDRILLQRAGAHYRFIHRTLQEHIAALTDERIAALAGPSKSR